MKEGINVLSLFDGMSCGQQALERLGIKVKNYYASEIDKNAIFATMANYPNTIQLGSVVDVDGYSLPQIDLLCGGSPCQSFSFAGKRKGMAAKTRIEYQYNEVEHEAYNLSIGVNYDQETFIEIQNTKLNALETIDILTLEHYLQLKSEGYEFEGESYLFWEFMRLLKEVKPRYFFLENVIMGEKWEKILTKAIGVNPIEINSSKVSAQNRRRLYWTNIGMAESGLFGDMESYISQPTDKKILLRDILEKEVPEKYFLELTENQLKKFNPNIDADKSGCLTLAIGRGGSSDEYMDAVSKISKIQNTDLKQIGNIYDNDHNSVAGRVYTAEGKSVTLSANGGGGGAKTGLYQIPLEGKNRAKSISPYQGDVLHYEDQKMQCLPAQGGNMLKGLGVVNNSRIRRLTPIECCRLQTVRDDYFFKDGKYIISETQVYKCLGNGWTVDVIAHIFKYMVLG